MKLELLTNATVVDDAIRFVSEKDAVVVANTEAKTDPPVIIEEKKQQQEQEHNTTEQQQKSDNSTSTTINQVF